jgi:hypothetical protein
MSEVKTVSTCPLGSTCERVANGVIERCAWYVKIEGTNPNTGEFMSESKCAMAWQPLLFIDVSGKLNENIAAVQSLRNETLKRQDIFLEVINGSKALTHR